MVVNEDKRAEKVLYLRHCKLTDNECLNDISMTSEGYLRFATAQNSTGTI